MSSPSPHSSASDSEGWPSAVGSGVGTCFPVLQKHLNCSPLAAPVCLGREELDALVTERFAVSGRGLVWGTVSDSSPACPSGHTAGSGGGIRPRRPTPHARTLHSTVLRPVPTA